MELSTDRNVQRHAADIARCREMISQLIARLEQYVDGQGTGEEARSDGFLGARETPLSALTRLVQLLEKVTALEQQWHEICDQQAQETENRRLSEHEWELLTRYVYKHRKDKDETIVN